MVELFDREKIHYSERLFLIAEIIFIGFNDVPSMYLDIGTYIFELS